MRKVISKSRAIKIVTLIFALIGILAVFPVRVFTQTLQTSGGGTIVSEPSFRCRKRFVTALSRACRATVSTARK